MSTNRIVALIDMDCFYVQCEQRLQPDKWFTPCAVGQYNNYGGGGLIAVNYEARPFGVKRGMSRVDAKKLCQDLHIFNVPEKNGKANLDRYRMASAEVFDAIAEFICEQENESTKNFIILERASVDEAFIDFTKFIDVQPLVLPDEDYLCQFNCKLELNGSSLKDWLSKLSESEQLNKDNMSLILGAILVGKIRQRIYEKTQFKCSAGISYNKMLAKLACSTNKPNAQTILPQDGVAKFFERVPISDVRLLGGKLGNNVKTSFGIHTMKELRELDMEDLENVFDDKTARWLHTLSRGFDDEEVSNRRLAKSIGCGKNFPGKSALVKQSDIQHWVKVLCEELHSRLESDKNLNKRLSKSLVVSYQTSTKNTCSKSMGIDVNSNEYPKPEKLANDILKQVFANQANLSPITNISIAAIKFTEEINFNTTKIDAFFQKVDRSAHIENSINFDKETSVQEDKTKNKNHNNNVIEKYFTSENLNICSDPESDMDTKELEENIDEDEPIYAEEEVNALMKTFFFKKFLLEVEEDE